MAIKEINIKDLSYEDLDKLFFHQGHKMYHQEVERVGIPSTIGANSKGLDTKESIFFSIGVENTLKLIDVWLKWRLDRLNNPFFNAKYQNVKKDTDLYYEYMYYRNKWYNEFVSNNYKNNEKLLNELFEFELNEGLINCYYYVLYLKEKEEFIYDQIDEKKVNAKDLQKAKAFYGNYSNFNTIVADRWNMQTIPGKKIIIDPERINMLTVDDKIDVISIVEYLYYLYLEHTKEKVDFMLLDDFISHIQSNKRTR